MQKGIAAALVSVLLPVCDASASEPASLHGNLISNPGFESRHFKGWRKWGVSSKTGVVRSLREPHSGKYYLRLVGDGEEEWSFVAHDIEGSLTWGDRIRASAWVQIISPESRSPFISIVLRDRETGAPHAGYPRETEGCQRWNRISTEFIIPDRTELPEIAQLQIEVNIGFRGEGSRDEMFVDDVHVEIVPKESEPRMNTD